MIKKLITPLLLILLIMAVSGCIVPQSRPICNPPYIIKGNDCCLDQNGNNICDNDEQETQQKTPSCGDGSCDSPENCRVCPQDCGRCEPAVKTNYEAIEKLKEDKDVSNGWKKNVIDANCPARYIDVSEGTVFTARIIVSKNIVECYKHNAFYTIKSRITNYLENESIPSGFYEKLNIYYNLMDSCEKELVEATSKILNGISEPSGYPIVLAETCSTCDDVWLVHLQCPVSDSENGISSFATAVVDSETGNVYW